MRIARAATGGYVFSLPDRDGWVSAAAAAVTARDLGELAADLPAVTQRVATLEPDLPDLLGGALGPPVRRPGKILAVGLNYLQHIAEVGKPRPTSPMIFAKYPSAVTGPYDPIELNPELTSEVDYEVELAVVIGRLARNVEPEHALEHVLGYCVANDISARDLQRQESQISRSKGLDTFCPLGPWITTTQEVGDPHTLRISTTVNDEKRQDSTTGDLLFKVHDLIAYLSRTTTLEPGDVILTGTPSGVGSGLKPPRYLRHGDVVRGREARTTGEPRRHPGEHPMSLPTSQHSPDLRPGPDGGSPTLSDYDVICIGGGLGGLAAAVRAHDLGARVLVLERSTMIGGVAAYSGGFCWVGANHLDRGGTDTLQATETYLDHVQGPGRPVDTTARRAYLRSAVEATRWFSEAGVPLSLIRAAGDLYAPCEGSTDQGRLLECVVPGAQLGAWREHLRPSVYYRTGVSRDEIYHVLGGDVSARLALAEQREGDDLLTHGVGLAAGFAREALVRRGVECRLEHRVTALLETNGRVTGVVADGPTGPVELTAGWGVIIAVGGYGNAPDAAELEDVPELIEAAPPVVAGDGLTLGQSVGATVVRGADPFVVLGARFAEQTHPGSDEPLFTQLLENLGFPHSLIVNRRGRRFGDESYYGALIRGLRTFDPRAKDWANFPCWLVFDESFHQQYPLGPYPPGGAYPAEVLDFDSLADLAAATGIDADGLAETVLRFNAFAADGEDADFARGSLPFARSAYGDPRYVNPNLGLVLTAPFHAVPLRILGVGLCSLGLAIDSSARVLRRDGSAIEGLYATGNAAATRELKGYVTGLANTRNYTYAFAAANAMHEARPVARSVDRGEAK